MNVYLHVMPVCSYAAEISFAFSLVLLTPPKSSNHPTHGKITWDYNGCVQSVQLPRNNWVQTILLHKVGAFYTRVLLSALARAGSELCFLSPSACCCLICSANACSCLFAFHVCCPIFSPYLFRPSLGHLF